MTCVVIQYENRREDYLEELMSYNVDYCRKQGYVYYRPLQDFDLPPYWIKILLLKQVLLANPEAQYIAWLDSDAVVHDQKRRIESLFPADKDFLISYCPWGGGDLNVGAFYIRVNDTTRHLVNDWWNCYTTANWSKVGGKWTCSGPWAGIDYEQGSFNERVLPRYTDVIATFPSTIFDETSPFPKPETFSCHFLHFKGTHKQTMITRYLLVQKAVPLLAFCAIGLGIGAYAYYRAA
jgi:hypothetical protein